MLDTDIEHRRVDHGAVDLRKEHRLALHAMPASKVELCVNRAEESVHTT